MNRNQNAERCRRRLPLVMAYVPWQEWGERYDDDRGFERGTIFPDLFYPFMGRGVGNR